MGPPCVYGNTILAATLLQYLPQTHQLGWFIFNSYVFNYILKGLGMQQAWLTAVAPQTNV
jgi:hypothetical protein